MGFLSSIAKIGGIVAAPFTGGASLLGTALSTAGDIYASARANSANRDLAREQMAFQERMSSTAYQRQMTDMRAAGLNPILAASTGGGASSPVGASATMSPVTARTAAQLGLLSQRAQIQNTQANTALTAQQARQARIDADVAEKLGVSGNLALGAAKGVGGAVSGIARGVGKKAINIFNALPGPKWKGK